MTESESPPPSSPSPSPSDSASDDEPSNAPPPTSISHKFSYGLYNGISAVRGVAAEDPPTRYHNTPYFAGYILGYAVKLMTWLALGIYLAPGNYITHLGETPVVGYTIIALTAIFPALNLTTLLRFLGPFK